MKLEELLNEIVYIKIHLDVKCERVLISIIVFPQWYSTIEQNVNLLLSLKPEKMTVKSTKWAAMDGCHQELPSCEVLRVIINSVPTINLNANSHLTLKPAMMKVNVNNQYKIEGTHQDLPKCDV